MDTADQKRLDALAGTDRTRTAPDGSTQFYDPVGGLWLTADEYLRNVKGRESYRRIVGDYPDYTDALNHYEKSRGL